MAGPRHRRRRTRDELAPFSDDLAAPYGVAAAGDAIDVINKYGLLRLFDEDDDGRAERTELLASGWGHTRDYHDWAVGLPRDAAGNYYVALPCQQDNRSPAAAYLRGQVIKLVPREPTAGRSAAICDRAADGRASLSAGAGAVARRATVRHRQPGQLQPVQRAEPHRDRQAVRLHQQAGKQAGLQSAVSAGRDRDSASLDPQRERDLFSRRAAQMAEDDDQRLFGPFAGHLVGCEYDTRRLVRMSLERVAGEFQGAVYPLSIEPAAGQETLRRTAGLPGVARRRCVHRQHPRQRLGRRRQHRLDRAAALAEQSAAGHRRSAGRAQGFTLLFTTPVDRTRRQRSRELFDRLVIAAFRRRPMAATTWTAAWKRFARCTWPTTPAAS